MALSLGSALASKVYLGATEVALAYLGATQVYSAGGAFSAEAQNYFDRLDTAGDTTYVDYKQPLANYIDSLVTLGGAYWDTMESAASFVGVGIQGITVPLRDGMPVITENNFVVGDLDQLTGLKGDGTTKYINTGATSSTLGINNYSLSVYLTADREAGGNRYISGANSRLTVLGNVTGFRARSASTTLYTLGSSTAVGELVGISRDNSADFDWSYETFGTQPNTSTDLGNDTLIKVFADESGNNLTAARLATYHVGLALDLATLEGLQATLLSEVAAAKGAAAAENYFARLDTAGDTTYVPYKQPLTNYISSLVALGGAYWDTMESAASFVGVGIQGITVPLRDGMPVLTQNNFVVGDLDQLTGLKGDGSTKYLATNVAGTAISQNDASISVYIKESHTAGGGFLLGNGTQSAVLRANATQRLHGSTALGTTPTPGLYGAARSTSTDIDVRSNATDYSAAVTSTAPNAGLIGIFALGTIVSSNARLATYHIGPALDLATLESLQDTLITEIAAI